MKKKKIFLIFTILTSCIFINTGCKDNEKLTVNDWTVVYDGTTNAIDILKGDKMICNDFYATYKLSETLLSSKTYSNTKIETKSIVDDFGNGYVFSVTYSSEEDIPDLIHSFYLYSDKDYILTEFELRDESGVTTNYMAPANIQDMQGVITGRGESRALFVPFDNDKWIRYKSHPLNFQDLTSYEVTAVFDNESRKGIVIGSVEHDYWKTGIDIFAESNQLSSLVCYGGIANETTRDVKSHGSLNGKSVKSPKVFVGYFDDWREGLETYADANAIVAPPRGWSMAVPFGWNSWGVLQFDLTFNKALQVSNFFKNKLKNSFENTDGLVYIGLDSGWNRFTEEELKEFADLCAANGQIAGIYWTPFTDWGKNPERVFEADPKYKYKDVYLYANGEPQELDGAYALDPTHPAVEAAMIEKAELFRRTGFSYVKMDFMTHGAMEADKWYNKNISTGIEGYNYGMKLLNKYFHDMYINLSISPIFPAQYAQSRRIACDAWNKIKDTEYTLNALSYGWWQDRVYTFNDPDHVVLNEATEGENRARITSAVITGMLILGDDYSEQGNEIAKERTLEYVTNQQINSIADGRAFRPVEGNGEESENIFYRKNNDNTLEIAFFNYTENDLSIDLPLERLGLSIEHEYVALELWSGAEMPVNKHLKITIPSKDVLLFKMNL